jgi:hypothetical protein
LTRTPIPCFSNTTIQPTAATRVRSCMPNQMPRI